MKVQGRPGETTPDEYAREVADRIVADILTAVRAKVGHLDVQLPDPEMLVTSMCDAVFDIAHDSHNELAALLGPFWTGARTREALGLNSRQALASRASNGSVLALKSADGDVFYPISQFQRRSDGTVEVKPALVPFLRHLRHFDPWAVGVLLHTPAPELGNLTPLDWARQDRDPATLIHLARAVAREWSAGAA